MKTFLKQKNLAVFDNSDTGEMNTYTIHLAQKQRYTAKVESNSLKEAKSAAMRLLPKPAAPNSKLKFDSGWATTEPSYKEFDPGKDFKSSLEALAEIEKQDDPFECLFNVIKSNCYWDNTNFALELLDCAREIINKHKEQGDGYLA